MKFYEDITVGEVEVLDATYVVTEEEIREVGERWDPQPFHIDPEAAQQSPFGGLVASSVHLFAMAVSLSNTGTKHDPVAAVSALGFDKMRLHAPARPGDELFVRTEVIEARRSTSQPALGVIRSRAEMLISTTSWCSPTRPPSWFSSDRRSRFAGRRTAARPALVAQSAPPTSSFPRSCGSC